MADGVAITAGSGTTILTDDTGASGHAQVVKLGISTDGSATLIPADATNGIDVDVTRVIPGTGATNLGKAEDTAHTDGDVGVLMLGVRNHSGAGTDGDYSALSVTSTGLLNTVVRYDLQAIAVDSAGLTTATTAYTAGDQVGTIFTLADAARVSGGGGMIRSVVLLDDQDIIGAYDVVFFRQSVTLAADNAAFSISDADAEQVVGIVQLAGSLDIGANRIAAAYNLAVPYDCAATSLFAALITRVGHTFFSGGVASLRLRVYVERN